MACKNIPTRNPINIHNFKALLLSSVALAALAFAPNPAFAANECGVAAPGGTVTCDGDGNPIADINPYAGGITYFPNGLTLNVNGAATIINSGANSGINITTGSAGAITINAAGTLTITTTGVNAVGILARSTGAGLYTVNSASNIMTSGNGGHAISVSGGATNAGTNSVNVTGGTFNTTGFNAKGINSFYLGSGISEITFAGILTTSGNSGSGISSRNDGLGAISIISSGNMTTTGTVSQGVIGLINNVANIKTVTINMTAGMITTGGSSSVGIEGRHLGLGAVDITTAGTIKTTNLSSRGINGQITNAANTKALSINMSGGSITTEGASSTGINNFNSGLGASSVLASGSIITKGTNSSGINMSSGAAASVAMREVKLTGGSITTSGNQSPGIAAVNQGLGTLLIETSAPISTAGTTSPGIDGRLSNAANTGTLTINFISSTINTTGLAGHGIRGRHFGSGIVSINSAGNITVTGANADGIIAQNFGGGPNNVTVSGVVSSQSGRGIFTDGTAATLSTITLNAGANVSTASAFAGAISNDEGNSNTTVNTGATVTGRIILRDGDDNLTFNGSSFAGVTRFDGGDDIFVGDGFIDVLTFAGSSGTLTGANVVNWEQIIIGAGSTIAFTDMALTAGLTTINNGGTFDAGNGFALSSDLTLNAGGIFDATGGGAGIFSIIGTTNNGGTITTQDGAAGDRLTFEGAYIGNNGRIHIDTVLGGDASATDLITANNGTAGTTTLNVQNVGGTGAATVAGIKVITLGGGVSNGTFVLDGDHLTPDGKQAIVGGAFSYRLEKQGSGDWHLISSLTPAAATPTVPTITTVRLYQPGSPVYEAYPQVLQALNAGQSYYQRLGSRYSAIDNSEPQVGDGTTSASSTNGSSSQGQRGPFWGKVSGQYAHVEPDLSTTSTRYNIRSGKMQLGIDMLAHEGASGNLFFGITGQYGFANADISSIFGNGSIKTKAYGLGITSTWMAANGFYLDGQAHFNWFNSDLNSDTLGSLTSGNDGFGQSWSLEAGMPIEASNGWMITPQAQLTWSNIRFDQFIGRSGELVSLGDGNSLIGRAGLSVAHDKTWTGDDGSMSRGHFYGIANIYRQFEDGTETIVSGTSLFDRQDELSGGIGLGFNVSWAEDKFSLFGDVVASTSLENTGSSYAYGGTVGFKVRF